MLKNVIFLFSKRNGWRTISSSIKQAESQIQPEIFNKLQTEFQDASYIKTKILSEQLKNTNIEQWRNCISVLRMFNFLDAECFKMIRVYPSLVHIPIDELESTANTWLACRLRLDDMCRALFERPMLLNVEASEISRRVPHLECLFKSKDSLCDLLVCCPSVMFDDWEDIQKKIHFLLKVKGIRHEKLLNSTALAKPLEYLKMRFDIAEKCGRYIRPSIYPHKRIKYDRINNPSLKMIVDSSNEVFTKEMKISLEEYFVYEDFFKLGEIQIEE